MGPKKTAPPQLWTMFVFTIPIMAYTQMVYLVKVILKMGTLELARNLSPTCGLSP